MRKTYCYIPAFLFTVAFCLVHLFAFSQKTVFPLNKDWQFRRVGTSGWLPATVPGTVHTDLMQNKKIDDPYYRTNEQDIQWIGTTDWEYRTTFTVSELLLQHDQIEIAFDGLDTYADVYLNNVAIIVANNMFRSWKQEIKSKLKKGSNELRIYFHSPINQSLPVYDSLPYKIPVSNNDQAEKRVSTFTRKAGYHFGWDWGPRLVTSGIWRPANLVAWNKVKLTDAFIKQRSLTSTIASLEAQLEMNAATAGVKNIEIYVDDSKNPVLTRPVLLSTGINQVNLPFNIARPELWWPNGLGKQKLYHFKIIVKDGEGIVDEIRVRRGLRTIEVVQESDAKGRSFYFKVNGVPVFMKGANYIPQDNFLPRVTNERYEHLINTAVNSNMNMLRVWGGGIYENDIFYDRCDEKGILVWQDFMFACSMYPPFEDFKKNVYAEAMENVKRLRNHPSIALWNGNNEIAQFFNQGFWGQVKDGWKNPTDSATVMNTYVEIFNNILPSAVKAYDDDKFYWSSSPSNDNYSLRYQHDLTKGDVHYWGVWGGKDSLEQYNDNIGRFVSEYGFQSFPGIETVKSFSLPEDYSIDSKVMIAHQRSNAGNPALIRYMKGLYQIPEKFEHFLYVGQLLQAEAIKIAIEGHRRSKPFCMGSLYWQIDDVWPAASWSSMDYYGRWKAQQYFVKKAYNEVLVSPVKQGDSLYVFVVSDKLTNTPARLQIQLMDFDGQILKTIQKLVSIPFNSSHSFYSIAEKDLIKGHNKSRTLLVTTLSAGDSVLSKNLYYFNKPKDLDLSKPDIRFSLKRNKNNYLLELLASTLVKNMKVTAGEGNIIFSDNYSDLLPNSKKIIRFQSDKEIKEGDLTFISLKETY